MAKREKEQTVTEIRSKKITLVPIEKIKPNPNNRNIHTPEQIERLSEIIIYQGFRDPLIVSNQSGRVVSGHGRLLAAKKIGLKQLPVTYQDFENEDQEYAAMVSENAIASWAQLDLKGINADLPDLELPSIDLLGIKNFKVDPSEKEGLTDEDSVPPTPKKSKTKLGDLYQLGDHRLLCGDSTQIDQVERLMGGEKADMVFTDPPYGFGYRPDFYVSMEGGMKRNKNDFEMLKNDTGDWDFDAGFILGRFQEARDIFLWGADYYCWTLPKHGSWIVWNKISEHSNLDNMPGASFELCWSKSKHKRHLIDITWRGCFGHNRKNDGDKKVHPTQKPVSLAEWFFNQWGSAEDKVVDLFGGSGSTLIACEKTNRRCFMSEIDPHYCSVIIERWIKFTGKEAYLVNEDRSQTSWTEIKTKRG